MDLILTLCLLLWLGTMWSLLKRRDIDPHEKIMWVVIVMIAPVFGALGYILAGPKRRIAEPAPSRPQTQDTGRIIDVKAIPVEVEPDDFHDKRLP